MGFWSKFFGKNSPGNHEQTVEDSLLTNGTNLDESNYVSACLNTKYEEMVDNRWFSDFPELNTIDRMTREGKSKFALPLCLKALEQYPDSFLFYGRAADIYDNLGEPQKAEEILKTGLLKSLSKCSLARRLAERSFRKNDYRDAIKWWIIAGKMQLESAIMVDKMPFLNLAYICQEYGMQGEEEWLFQMADKASNEGSVRLNAKGVELLHALAKAALAAGDEEVRMTILELHRRCRRL